MPRHGFLSGSSSPTPEAGPLRLPRAVEAQECLGYYCLSDMDKCVERLLSPCRGLDLLNVSSLQLAQCSLRCASSCTVLQDAQRFKLPALPAETHFNYHLFCVDDYAQWTDYAACARRCVSITLLIASCGPKRDRS